MHRARLASGREVAVKVQYPSVRRQLQMDLATISIAVKIIGRMFPKFEFRCDGVANTITRSRMRQ